MSFVQCVCVECDTPHIGFAEIIISPPAPRAARRDVLHAGYVRDPTLKAAHRRSTRDGAPLPAAKGMLLMVTLRT